MSRQRIRTGVLEGSTVVCEHCAGTGMRRSTSSIALHVLRLLEEALIGDASRDVTVQTRGEIGLYILNHKRLHLTELEARFGVAVTFETDEHLTGMTYCTIERGEPASGVVQPMRQIPIYEPEADDLFVEEEDEAAEETHLTAEPSEPESFAADEGEGRRKRRRRRGRGRDREASGIGEDAPQPSDDALSFVGDMGEGRVENEPVVGEMADGVAADVGDADDRVGADDAVGAESRDEPRRRRSRRGGRRAREGRERHIEAEGSADSQPRFGDEDGAPTEVPIAALGEVATFGEGEPTALPHEAAATAEPSPSESPVEQTVELQAPTEAEVTEPAREPVPASIEAAAIIPDAAGDRPAPAEVTAVGDEGATEAREAVTERAPRRPEPGLLRARSGATEALGLVVARQGHARRLTTTRTSVVPRRRSGGSGGPAAVTSVAEVDRHADHQPYREPDPGVGR